MDDRLDNDMVTKSYKGTPVCPIICHLFCCFITKEMLLSISLPQYSQMPFKLSDKESKESPQGTCHLFSLKTN